jgi:CBS domain containing-hemolysin-like protein
LSDDVKVNNLVLAISFFMAVKLALIAASRHHVSQFAQQTDRSCKPKAAQVVQSAQNDLWRLTQSGTPAGSLLEAGDEISRLSEEPDNQYSP